MSRKDYERMAVIIGQSLAVTYRAAEVAAECDTQRNGRKCHLVACIKERAAAGERARTILYGSLYEGFIAFAAEDNDRFDETRFAFAVAQEEMAYRADLLTLGVDSIHPASKLLS